MLLFFQEIKSFFVLSFGNNNILSTKEQNREEESVLVILSATRMYYQNRLFKRTVNIEETKKISGPSLTHKNVRLTATNWK